MIRIGLEAGFDPGWPAGLMYVKNLVYSLAALPKGEQPLVRLLPITADTIGRIADLGQLKGVEIAAPVDLHPSLLEARLRLRRAVRKYIQPRAGRILERSFEGLDVTYPDFGRALPGIPQMHWIPDLQHVHLPDLFSAEELGSRARRVRDAAFSTDFLVLSSEAARQDLLALHPDLTATLRVWRFCTTLTENEQGGRDPREAFNLPDVYLYVANQFWAHKEHLTLFKALVSLRAEGVAPTVVCTGPMTEPRDPTYVPGLMRFLAENGLDDQVKLLGLLKRKDQLQVLRFSAGVIQPSRFEGWSTVIEDAKAVGRPILASDIEVHVEQAPGETFFKTGSEEDLAHVIANWAPILVPGPDPTLEAEAASRAKARRLEAGRAFLDIAREAAADG